MSAEAIRTRTAELAASAGVAGLIAAIPALPTAVKGILLGLFVLCGPGAAVLSRFDLPLSMRLSAIPVIGLTAVLLSTWATSETVGLSPLPVLLVLATATVLAAVPTIHARRRA